MTFAFCPRTQSASQALSSPCHIIRTGFYFRLRVIIGKELQSKDKSTGNYVVGKAASGTVQRHKRLPIFIPGFRLMFPLGKVWDWAGTWGLFVI
jgi:hypothetical protein